MILPTRRSVLVGAALARPFLARPAFAANARVVIIGGGFGGASLARLLATAPGIAVTLVEPNAPYTACPLSNQVIAGLRGIEANTINYAHLGLAIVQASAVSVDPTARKVVLSTGQTLDYDRLVLSPGIDFAWDKLPGTSAAAAEIMPHAWKGAAQMALLRRKLDSMEDGGTVVMTVPEAPYRCPPAPYDRASLIAHVIKTRKPRSKLIVLDSKEQFSNQKLFQAAWDRLYKGIITWVPPSEGGKPAAIDAKAGTITTDFDSFQPSVANVIPPQKAGMIAQRAGVTDGSGWCPVNPTNFASRLQPDIHVIGDAVLGGPLPKSATVAHSQAQACAVALLHAFGAGEPEAPRIASACYNVVAPNDGFSVLATYKPDGDLFSEIKDAGRVTPLDATQEMRAEAAKAGDVWFQQITRDSFG